MKKVDLLGLTLFTLMTMSTLGGILSGCRDRTNEPQQKGVVKTNAQEIDLPLYYPGTSDNTEVKEAIVLRYYGHCRTENGQRIYDISPCHFDWDFCDGSVSWSQSPQKDFWSSALGD